MRATIVHDANIEITGIDVLAAGLPITLTAYVTDSPEVPGQLTPPGSLWVVAGDGGPDAQVPAAPLDAWLENPTTTPDLPISLVFVCLPDTSLPTALFSGYLTQAMELDRDLVIQVGAPPGMGLTAPPRPDR